MEEPLSYKRGNIMKLAITQIVLGVLVLLVDSLIIGAAFSTHFGYILPHGEIVEQVFPSALAVTRGATIVVIPIALTIVGCGIAQLIKARRKYSNHDSC
jgi:hypothetical protein